MHSPQVPATQSDLVPAVAGASTDRVPVGCDRPARWTLERVLFLLAGIVTGTSAALAAALSPWFLLLTGFVAVNQLLFVAVGNCPTSWLLRRYAGLRAGGER